MTRRPLALLAALLLAAPAARAATPQKLGYQGQLLKADGTPVSGIKDLTFAVYDAPTGGNVLWAETQTLALTEGFYATFLADVTAFPAGTFDGAERWLELTIDGQKLEPRQRIASVPYALRSGSADLATNADHATDADHATTATNLSGGTVDATSIKVNGTTVIDSSGQLAGSTRYQAGAGLALDGTTFSLLKTCADGEHLAWNAAGSAWECRPEPKAGTGLDAASGVFSVKYGSTAGTAAAGDDARLSDARAPKGSASGDLAGSYPGPNVAKLQGISVAPVSPLVGQVLGFNGSAWTPVGVGSVTSVSGSGPITVSNGSTTPTITIANATSTAAGAMSASDKSLFDDVAAQIACTAAGKKIVGTGTGFTCVGEDDPKTGTLTSGRICRTDGAKVLCDSAAPALDGSGNVTVAGTVTASAPVATSNVATKGYVDTTVAAAAGAANGTTPYCIYVNGNSSNIISTSTGASPNYACPAGFTKQSIVAYGTSGDALRYDSGMYQIICCAGVGGSSPVPSDDSTSAGYFVLTQSTYNGNLGGLAGADAKCLSELTTKVWLGKGILPLTSAKVHAFLCDGATCNDLKPSTRYYFAGAGSVAGGASFITDRYGRGPNDASAWPWGSYVWTNRGTQSATTWQIAPSGSTANNHCNGWTDSTTNYAGMAGTPGSTNSNRWENGQRTCSNTHPLICYVDP